MQGPVEIASYLGYSAGWHTVRRMPERTAYATFSKLADQVWRQRGTGVRQLERNLARVDPGATQAQLRELSRAGMQSYFRYWCDAFRLPDWGRTRIVDSVDLDRPELLAEPIAAGTGLVVALPHMGNWDHAGAFGSVRFAPVVSVAENLKPEALTRKFIEFREELGMEIVTLRRGEDVYEQVKAKLQQNKIVALLGDRDITRSGVPVDFFGEPTRMPAGPAALAIETGAPLIVGQLTYGPSKLIGRFTDPLAISTATDQMQAIRETTQTIAAEFEKAIAPAAQDWHMLQPLWLADLDADRLAVSRYEQS